MGRLVLQRNRGTAVRVPLFSRRSVSGSGARWYRPGGPLRSGRSDWPRCCGPSQPGRGPPNPGQLRRARWRRCWQIRTSSLWCLSFVSCCSSRGANVAVRTLCWPWFLWGGHPFPWPNIVFNSAVVGCQGHTVTRSANGRALTPATAVDETIHRYHRVVRELWKFCWFGGGGTHIEVVAGVIIGWPPKEKPSAGGNGSRRDSGTDLGSAPCRLRSDLTGLDPLVQE